MSEQPGLRKNGNPCEALREELEELPARGPVAATPRNVLEDMPEVSRNHARGCAECTVAVEEFVSTRNALQELAGEAPKPGPWFPVKVMAVIAAREAELEMRREGVWLSVRRSAPRLALASAFLLVLGAGWALEIRQEEKTAAVPLPNAWDRVFGAVPANTPLNDDVMISAREESRP